MWYSVLQAATQQIIRLNELNDQKEVMKEMVPYVAIRKLQNYRKAGQSYRALNSFKQLTRVHSPAAIAQRELIASMFEAIPDLEPSEVFKCFGLFISGVKSPELVPGLNLVFYKIAFKQYTRLGYSCPEQILQGCFDQVTLSPQ